MLQHTNRPRLFALADSFSNAYHQNRALALGMARKNKWPLQLMKEDGGMRVLYGITRDGLPVYGETLNREAGITTRTDQLYTGGILDMPVHGESMVAGMWDVSGVLLSHELFEGRVSQMDPMYTSVTANHSTHVAGTIIGSDAPKNGLARGMAFRARLHAYDWYNDLSEAANAAANGLLISCHPYSLAPQPITYWGTYIDRTASWDQIMHEAPHYLVVWAAGNGGPYADRLTNEAANKNGLAIGSVHQVNAYNGPASVQLSAFSSRGPARDGRIKPDLVAKGEGLYSSNFNANNTSYNYGWGTSMASAGAAGTLLLLQQHYRNRSGGRTMKAATLKALSVHTADEAGPAPGPDIQFGWGLLNAAKAAMLISTGSLDFKIEEYSLHTGAVYEKTVTAAGDAPLVATLCWTDPPGMAVTNPNDRRARLVNDLDIRISANGNNWYPWSLDTLDAAAAATTGDNNRDNLERIEIPNPVAGQTYLVRVTHKGVLQPVTGNGRQDFSLVISGERSCQQDRILTGLLANSLYASATWIRITGQATVAADRVVQLDADPQNGYIELVPEGNGDSFFAAPVTGEFTAALVDGCGSGVPASTAVLPGSREASKKK